MLSYNETTELLKLAKENDKKAIETLVIENSPLVKSIVKRYLKKNVEYDDLFQLGSLGLIKAIKNFDLSFNVRFSTYAVPMIAGEIKRFLRDDGSIKVSRSVKMFSSLLKAFIEEYKEKNDVPPTLEFLAEQFNCEMSEIVFTMGASKMPISLFEKQDETSEKGQRLLDKISTGDKTDNLIDKLALKKELIELDKKEQKIILLRYFRGKTQSEVASILNVSQVQVSRLENKILERLKMRLSGEKVAT